MFLRTKCQYQWVLRHCLDYHYQLPFSYVLYIVSHELILTLSFSKSKTYLNKWLLNRNIAFVQYDHKHFEKIMTNLMRMIIANNIYTSTASLEIYLSNKTFIGIVVLDLKKREKKMKEVISKGSVSFMTNMFIDTSIITTVWTMLLRPHKCSLLTYDWLVLSWWGQWFLKLKYKSATCKCYEKKFRMKYEGKNKSNMPSKKSKYVRNWFL